MIIWSAIAAVAVASSACGEDKRSKAVVTAEPKPADEPPPQAAPAPPPPAAEPPATPPAPAPGPEGTEHPGHHGGKGKGEHGAKGPHGGPPEGEGGPKGGEHDKSQKVIRLGRAHMEFNHPGNGWTERKKGPWTLFAPKDKTSILGFVEFESPRESTSRIGQIASHLELTNIAWHGAGEDRQIGQQHLKAHHAEGTCKVVSSKHDCEIEYYTVEGALLIVYAFETDVKKVEKKERMATRSVESLRRF